MDFNQATTESYRLYGDIIDEKHPHTSKHPPMSRIQRASQFAPFAALSGHEECLQEVSRYTDKCKIIEEDKLAELNYQLLTILSQDPQPPLKITYFKEDLQKDGGTYESIVTRNIHLDKYTNELVLMTKERINTISIQELEIISEEEYAETY